jgi:diguanylate cyclase (GGDEF)-like protein/PAS domain S-box-containing protein
MGNEDGMPSATGARLARQESRNGTDKLKREDLPDSNRNIVFAFDADWRIRAANWAAEILTGYTRDELLTSTLWDLVPAESRMRTKREWLASQDREIPIEIVTRAGDLRKLHLSWTEDVDSGKGPEYLATARDVTASLAFGHFERSRQRVLELLAGDAPLKEILAYLARVVEGEIGDSLCAVVLPTAALSKSDHPHFDPALACEAAKVVCAVSETDPVAFDEERGIVMRYLDDNPTGRNWQWSIALTAAADSPRIVVLRRGCLAPETYQAELLVNAAGLLRVILEHHRLTSQLRYQAHHDALTGLPNRQRFGEYLRQALDAAAASGLIAGILYIDVDDFKLINDGAGHTCGDKILAGVAGRMRAAVSRDIVVARVGGDEFNILIPEAVSRAAVEQEARRLMHSLEEPFEIDGHEYFVSITIGISLFPDDGHDLNHLLKHADSALYRAKTDGKNSVLFYQPSMTEAANSHLSVRNQLRRAIERDELSISYQTQFSLKTNTIVGVEALLRWRSAKLGVIPPSLFIPVAESSGLILPIGQWVLENVCTQGQAWRASGCTLNRLAVNVSALQFRQPAFVQSVADALQASGLHPGHLELELTESVVMRDFAESACKIAGLREMGISIAIDDFGTGYSSLSYLERLPVDSLKIDQSFIRKIVPDQPRPALVTAIIGLAHSLGMQVLAEGIETEYQRDLLCELGCDQGQGFFYSRPVGAADLKFPRA